MRKACSSPGGSIKWWVCHEDSDFINTLVIRVIVGRLLEVVKVLGGGASWRKEVAVGCL